MEDRFFICQQSFNKQFSMFVDSGFNFYGLTPYASFRMTSLIKIDQLPRMCDIYSHSILTVAISCSKESTGHMFSTVSPFRNGFHLSDAEGHKSDLMVRERFPHTSGSNPYDIEFNQLHDTFPLLERAWVFQERFLSSRVLHFGAFS